MQIHILAVFRLWSTRFSTIGAKFRFQLVHWIDPRSIEYSYACYFIGGGALGPHLPNVTWAEASTKWHLDPCSRLDTIHGPKRGLLHLF